MSGEKQNYRGGGCKKGLQKKKRGLYLWKTLGMNLYSGKDIEFTIGEGGWSNGENCGFFGG